MRLDHIAIVTRDLARAQAVWELLGFTPEQPHEVSEHYPETAHEHRYRAVTLRAGTGPSLWVMEPVGDEGPLAHYLARRGPGLHHLGLATENIEAEVARLKARGLTFVREPHHFHADHEIRALLVPRDCDGVLVELVQVLPGSPHERS